MVDDVLVGDYDQPRRRIRLRAATTKTKRALWVELHPSLADLIEAVACRTSQFRDPQARLFAPSSGADALRTCIAKACRKTLAIPVWSPHDLRHRRISLLHVQGMPWARIGEFVGQRNLSVTANTYTHVLVDEARARLPAAARVACAELALRAVRAVEEQPVIRPIVDPVRLPVVGVHRQPPLAALDALRDKRDGLDAHWATL